MLDENLPTFYIKPSSDTPHSSTIYLSQNASELQPEYTLRHPDPSLPASENCYAVALYDSYNPEVLFAEVMVQPEWTQPTLSQAEIRAQNGIPPPPVPIVPNSFAIQLYNPDQQVIVRQIAGSWNSSAYWEFEMPQNTFRLPSVSALDRSQSDPAASDVTPKVAFKWKRDGKLSKDISCFLAGKSTDGRKNKEPDITISMFKGGRDLTLYQPNFHRVEVEDTKGLEVVLLLSAAVIKDIFFNPNREMFNISSPTTTNTKRKYSSPTPPLASGALIPSPPPRRSDGQASTSPPPPPPGPQQQQRVQNPPVNARTQWEIDRETARLRALVEAEERERERMDRQEQERIKKMLAAEEKEQKRRDAEVAKETERLRKQYGVTGIDSGPRVHFNPPLAPPRPQPFPQYHSAPQSRPVPVQRPLSTPTGNLSHFGSSTIGSWFGGPHGAAPQMPPRNSGPYLQAPGNGTASSSGFFGLGGRSRDDGTHSPGTGRQKLAKKRSVFF